MESGAIVRRFRKQFPDEASCLERFTAIRFRNGRYCPYCGSLNTYEFEKLHRFRCGRCKRDFSVLSNTVFEGAHLDLRQYFLILSLLTEAKQEIPLRTIVELSGCSEKSARRAIRLFKTSLEGADADASKVGTKRGRAEHGKAANRS